MRSAPARYLRRVSTPEFEHDPRPELVLGSVRHTAVLEPEGVRITRRWGSDSVVPYPEITHLVPSPRGLWIASRSNSVFVRAGGRPEVVRAFGRALLERVAAQPDGQAALTRMRAIDTLALDPYSRVATSTVIAVCLAVYALQLADPFVVEIGSFVPPLVAAGELWRVLTANFLHGTFVYPFHLMSNGVALAVLALLVERPLGAARCTLVMTAAGLVAMLACGLAGHRDVIGASGLVAGLAGAALALELHAAERLPASWRLPRRLFMLALVAQALFELGLAVLGPLLERVFGVFLPRIASAAHLGGFVAGYLVALPLLDTALRRVPTRAGLRIGALAAALVAAVALAALAPFTLRSVAALNLYANDLLASDEGHSVTLNNLAWRIVTETTAPAGELEPALLLATRAVEESEGENPDFLDTLAEVQFAVGDDEAALETIEAALVIAPWDDYFQAQRERFAGGRPADERPESPGVPWFFRRPPFLPPLERGEPEPETRGAGLARPAVRLSGHQLVAVVGDDDPARVAVRHQAGQLQAEEGWRTQPHQNEGRDPGV
jgi:rhomboid protease GluP